RSLNELVTWRFSYLTKTSAPVSADSRGAGSIGVRSTWPAMTRRAASMSASFKVNGYRSKLRLRCHQSSPNLAYNQLRRGASCKRVRFAHFLRQRMGGGESWPKANPGDSAY